MQTIQNRDQWRWLRATGSTDISVISVIIFDIDGTVYTHPGYHNDGTRGEIAEIATILGQSPHDIEMLVMSRRQELTFTLDRPAAMTETVISLGVTRAQWNELRCRAWQPEKWLTRDPTLCKVLGALCARYRIAFGTNSPLAVGQRVLQAIGITEVTPDIPVFGPESFGVSKPHPDFFVRISEALGCVPFQCVSIGDREANDGIPAVDAGFTNALIVSGRDALIAGISQLFNVVEMQHG